MKSITGPQQGMERQGITFTVKKTTEVSANVPENLFKNGKPDELVTGLKSALQSGEVKAEPKTETQNNKFKIGAVVAYLQKSRDNALAQVEQLKAQNEALRERLQATQERGVALDLNG